MRAEELSFFDDEDFLNSLKRYETALEQGTHAYMEADELTDIAEYYSIKGNEEKADKCISFALQIHPEAVDPQIFLSRREMFKGDLNKALQIANSIVDQEDEEVTYLKAEILIRNQQIDEADRLLQSKLENTYELTNDFIYNAAYVFMDYAIWDKANKWIKELLNRIPKSKKAIKLRCDFLVSTGKCKEVIPELNKLLDDNPYDKSAWILLSEAQCGIEKYQEALESIEYVLAIDENDSSAMQIRANCLFHLNKMKKAHEQYMEYLKKYPLDVTVLYLDGVCLTNLGLFEQALKVLQLAEKESLGYAPEQFNICIQLCYLYSKLHRTEEAFEKLKTAEKYAEEDFISEEHFLKGHIFLEMGNKEKAEAEFNNAMLNSKDKLAIELSIGISYCENEYYSEAISYLAPLRNENDKYRKQAIVYLAYCYLQINHKQFETMYAEAKAINPNLTDFLFEKEMQ